MATFKMALLLAGMALACDDFKIRCEVTCEQDGDERGVVIDDKCYCANKRDIKHVPVKINKLKGGLPSKPPTYPGYILGEQ